MSFSSRPTVSSKLSELALVCLMACASPALGGEKVQVTQPTRTGSGDDLKNLERKKIEGSGGSGLLDRPRLGGGGGGGVDGPNFGSTDSSKRLDPKSTKKLLERLDRDKNWSLADPKDFEREQSGSSYERDAMEEDSMENSSLNNRRPRSAMQRALEQESSYEPGDLREQRDQREQRNQERNADREDSRSTDRRRPNTFNSNDRSGSRLDLTNPSRRNPMDRDRNNTGDIRKDGPDAGGLIFSDPFAPPVARSDSPLGTGIGRSIENSFRQSATTPASFGERERQDQFRQLIGTSPSAAGATRGLGEPGTAAFNPNTRQEQFRSLLGPSTPRAPMLGSDSGGRPPSVTDLNRSAAPGFGGISPTPAPALSGPSFVPAPPPRMLTRPQPATLTIPSRVF